MSLLSEIKSAQIPAHIAIIMDGNGRWAKQRNLPRTSGHKEGLEVAKKIVKAAKEVGVKYITLYTFSTENWKRTQDEVGYLMGLIKNHLRAEFKFYKENDIRVKHIGNLSGLPQDIQNEINSTVEECKDFNSLTVVLAINYGGKDEISRAINKAKSENKEINENNFTEFFDLPEMPDVDLIIRTGGEKRLSNFLLWHGAYAELDFVDTLWPDYNEECFYQSIKEFQKRNRRFGGL
ncbi:MAG: polyprenyl diphosphate synthase [Treponemataceae bacterium]|jgi:undecaprenyl diphosphate synthase|nr:di-trans,poly-cis-decaprenylcistransferase [Spirochaetaceae bacterium]MEE0878695.1 polyprenyl diphosphate synthase [Treponemataceae bacterium]